MKDEKTHKVNMEVRGSLRHLTYKLHALIKAARLGLKTNKLATNKLGHLEMEFEGKKTELWKIVGWSKGCKFFSSVEEIVFTFSSVSKTSN